MLDFDHRPGAPSFARTVLARDRYLELAPKHWRGTRAKLDPAELDSPLSAFEIPAPIVAAASDPQAAPTAAGVRVAVTSGFRRDGAR